ncbi:MAG: hypothetical protein J0H14_00585 [Alphaproteobacteria bacterium]|nr:hypothetical protein [Alphaproteobacteria bacterium]
MSGTMRLSRNAKGIVVNDGDILGDDLASMSVAEREIREATVGILLNMFRRQGEFTCTKVRARGVSATPLGSDLEVSGYVTILRDILGKSPRKLEGTLGFATGGLSAGAEVLFVSSELVAEQIGPRYMTSWSAGASPQDLWQLGAKPHPSYPPASDPIFQCVIYRNRPARGRLMASLGPDQVFNWPAPP